MTEQTPEKVLMAMSGDAVNKTVVENDKREVSTEQG